MLHKLWGVCLALVLLSACSSQSNQVSEAFSLKAEEVTVGAMSLIGVPYTWGGNSPESGFDCSGLIVYVYNNVGIKLPRTTTQMSKMSLPNVKRNHLQAGDIVFFATSGWRRGVSHAGIYVGKGRFVHAPNSGETVKISNLKEPYWSRSFLTGKRIIN